MSSSPRTRSGEGYWQWSSRRWSTRGICRILGTSTRRRWRILGTSTRRRWRSTRRRCRRLSTSRSCRTSAANSCEVADLKFSVAFLHAAWQKLGDLPPVQWETIPDLTLLATIRSNDEVPTILPLVRALRSDVGSKVVVNLIGTTLPEALPRHLIYGSLSDSMYSEDTVA